jgi:hypothetical protein
MQMALRVPSTIGRKVLPALLAYDADESVLDKAWATEAVCRELNSTDKKGAASKLIRLAGLDRDYSALLDSAVNSETSTSQYAAWLAGQYTSACLLAHDVSYDLGVLTSRCAARASD